SGDLIDMDTPTSDKTQLRPLRPTGMHPSRSACVVVIHGEGLGRRADIGPQPVVIGRSNEADLVLASQSVSRMHCRIWADGGSYRIRDLGATNVTRVNDTPLREDQTLSDGDQITVGDCTLKFISQDSMEARYHEQIYQLAVSDTLTDLYNRRHFTEIAEKEIARAARHTRALSLCIIDVDLFKSINDRYGHVRGDEVLRQVAMLLRRHTRDDDIAARIGGEEFALLLPERGPNEAALLAERLREAVADTPFASGDAPLRITISIGVATLMPGQKTPLTELMTAADTALYRAKSDGRNKVRVEI
ncbi:MAG: GGDEF domain-containing protein, partial [Nevskiaceae bacterium]|nr:GGDEF domain-containing protein [Nevskiaceae bacterium]